MARPRRGEADGRRRGPAEPTPTAPAGADAAARAGAGRSRSSCSSPVAICVAGLPLRRRAGCRPTRRPGSSPALRLCRRRLRLGRAARPHPDLPRRARRSSTPSSPPSCSSILSVLGLTALTATVLRSRTLARRVGAGRGVVAVAVVANDLRLAASTLAGLWWGRPALVLFHDWVGTLWNFAATLGGFLAHGVAHPARGPPRRAGRRRPAHRPPAQRLGAARAWATAPSARQDEPRVGGQQPHRPLLPLRAPRLGHPSAGRPSRGRPHRLPARSPPGRPSGPSGCAPWSPTGSARTPPRCSRWPPTTPTPRCSTPWPTAVAARQWEPVTDHRVAALRLWARGWRAAAAGRLSLRPPPAPGRRPTGVPTADGARLPPVHRPPTASGSGRAVPQLRPPRSGRRPLPTEDMR